MPICTLQCTLAPCTLTRPRNPAVTLPYMVRGLMYTGGGAFQNFTPVLEKTLPSFWWWKKVYFHTSVVWQISWQRTTETIVPKSTLILQLWKVFISHHRLTNLPNQNLDKYYQAMFQTSLCLFSKEATSCIRNENTILKITTIKIGK